MPLVPCFKCAVLPEFAAMSKASLSRAHFSFSSCAAEGENLAFKIKQKSNSPLYFHLFTKI